MKRQIKKLNLKADTLRQLVTVLDPGALRPIVGGSAQGEQRTNSCAVCHQD